VNDVQEMVDWVQFERSRAELGPGLIRILGYFREDGVKSLGQIEHGRAGHPRPHAQGRSAPAWR